jgi:ribosome maturation factor RimP
MRIPEELRVIVEENVVACGAHVIDLVLRGDPRRPVVEIYVDAPGPVTTDLCGDISRRIAAGIDAGEFLASAYRLEVSSPGIDRPLQYPWQYGKHVGRDMRVRTQPPGGVVSEVTGTLLSLDDASVRISCTTGEDVVIPFTQILEAKVMPPW